MRRREDNRAGWTRWLGLAAAVACLAGAPAALHAQPFGLWTAFDGDGLADTHNGSLQIPDSPALNPTGAITIEAWVSLTVPSANQDCRSIIGKDYKQSYWMGVCNSASSPTGAVLRSYVRGTSSVLTGGPVPSGIWTHLAITSDGVTRNHYVDGELVATFHDSGPPTGSTAALQIGGDANWVYSPNGSVNEVRLWNVARTQAEIQADINVHLGSAQPGLVAVWQMNSPNDSLGVHNGTFHGELPHVLGPPAEASCGASGPQTLCLQGHFLIGATFRTGAPGTASTSATVVPVANTGSGLFWFFTADDWELMAKVINGCGLNSQWWVFSAATTNVFYRLTVTDVQSGESKIYFNYQGPPAPAVTDTAAFPCP